MNIFDKLGIALALVVGLLFAAPAYAVDLAVTATSVVPTASTIVQHGTAGGTITAGQVVYLDANNLYQLANGTVSGTAKFSGIALNNASINQALSVAVSGNVTFNAILTKGVAVYLSNANNGGLCLVADMASGKFVVMIGVATSTTNLQIGVVNSGVTL